MSFRVSIADVAREAGVSRQTVSRALNNKGEISSATLQRVREVIDRLDYRPSSIARGLATHHTRTIGLVVPDIANPFFADISRGADDLAHAAGYSLLLCNSVEDQDREADLLRILEQHAVDGVVLCSSRLSESALVELVRRHDAVVLINHTIAGSDSVCVDDARGAGLVVQHLMRSGRRRIALVAGPRSSFSSRRAGARLCRSDGRSGCSSGPRPDVAVRASRRRGRLPCDPLAAGPDGNRRRGLPQRSGGHRRDASLR